MIHRRSMLEVLDCMSNTLKQTVIVMVGTRRGNWH